MIQLEEMRFLLFDFCDDMKINGLDYDDEFEVLLLWDQELKDNYKDNEIFEDEDENTDYSKYYKNFRDLN